MRTLDESENFELKLALFEMHSRQHCELRQKIHLTTERYVTVMIALVALLNSNFNPLCDLNGIRWLACITVLLIMFSIIYMIIKDNRSSLLNAKIVSSLNEDFGLFSKGKIIKQTTLYPPKWRNWGNEKWIKGTILHICIIIMTTVLFFLSLFLN